MKSRKAQERTAVTRNKLVAAASILFTEHGYEGVTTRDLEKEAGVQRGLLAYHFGDRESLWKVMADETFALMRNATADRLDLLQDLGPRERVSAVIRFYVRFSAEHPELARLLAQEARHDSWRIQYLVEEHISKIRDEMMAPLVNVLGMTDREFVHWYYLLAGGSSLIFSHAPECQLLFGVDSRQEEMVEAHADLMVKVLLGETPAEVRPER